MRVKWLDKALENLDTEATYIARDNSAPARLVVQRIVNAINLLPKNPVLGRPAEYLVRAN